MSDAVSYMSEPPTVGKVLVQTTIGDFDIELFATQTPKACRNFVQHCLDGYYNNCIFHRVIKGFMAQSGDPTGSGLGGEPAFGEGRPFEDEFHSRLRFTRRGLVAMASNGRNQNRSQFFITLGPCEFLNNKHTLFGKLTGDTLFNILKFEELEIENPSGDKDEDMEGKDRPYNPPKIIKTEVLVNPFDDLKPRIKEVATKKDERPKKKQKKNLTLLSFGEEEAVEESILAKSDVDSKTKGGKSSHDLAEDARLSRRTIEEAEAERLQEDARRQKERDGDGDANIRQNVREALSKKKSSATGNLDEDEIKYMDEAVFDAHMRQKLLQKKGIIAPAATTSSDRVDTSTGEKKVVHDDPADPSAVKKEYNKLKAELKQSSNIASAINDATRGPVDTILSKSEQLRAKFKSRKQNTTLADREAETLARLAAFKNNLTKAKETAEPIVTKPMEVVPKHSTVEIPPVPIQEDDDTEMTDPTDPASSTSWMVSQFKVKQRPQDFNSTARAGHDYAVLDPRNIEGSSSLPASFAEAAAASASKHSKRRHHGTVGLQGGNRGMSGVDGQQHHQHQHQSHASHAASLTADENERIVQRLLEEEVGSKRKRSRSRSRSPNH